MINKPLVGIIDISINNILSIKRTFEHIGSEVMVINEQRNIQKFDIIVLPGVGAYHEAMKKLRDTKIILSIEQALNKNKNFLGICLGMQLFANSSQEGNCDGLGWIDATVKKFKFSKSTSEIPTNSLSICCPFLALKFKVIDFLFRESISQFKGVPGSPSFGGPLNESPVSGCSTLITSAPKSPRRVAPQGPASKVPMSRTLIPSSGLVK